MTSLAGSRFTARDALKVQRFKARLANEIREPPVMGGGYGERYVSAFRAGFSPSRTSPWRDNVPNCPPAPPRRQKERNRINAREKSRRALLSLPKYPRPFS